MKVVLFTWKVEWTFHRSKHVLSPSEAQSLPGAQAPPGPSSPSPRHIELIKVRMFQNRLPAVFGTDTGLFHYY